MNEQNLSRMLSKTEKEEYSPKGLSNGARVAVIGGGPAGSFFSYFLLDMAERIDLKIQVDIYEPRDFKETGPSGCNMCGGVIYESLVQALAVEGINLPPGVVQRGIEFNMLHMDIGSVKIHTPRHEKRIATTYRGAGPRGVVNLANGSFDGYLLQTAIAKGAHHIPSRVSEASWRADPKAKDPDRKLIQVRARGIEVQTYELVAVTAGVNSAILKRFSDLDFGYQIPKSTKLLVREYFLGEEKVSKHVGPVFHAFLLDIPGLDYGAIIPKGDYLTVCLLSSHGDLDTDVMEAFLSDPAVKRALPPGFSQAKYACNCGPRINVKGGPQPFGDRIVFIGDSGISRLYKDGIGAAYRSAKIAAATAVFQGVSENDFKKHYLPFCRKVEADNRIGKWLFRSISQVQRMKFARRAVLQMVSSEQQGRANAERGMSTVMWDMLTGGAHYSDVLKRILHPMFIARFAWNLTLSLLPLNGRKVLGPADSIPSHTAAEPQNTENRKMDIRALGKIYEDGEIIVRQGERGDCMYVVQDGEVEVLTESGGRAVKLRSLGNDEFFGEMAIFQQELRTATVRAKGQVRILSVDHKNLLQRIHEDPSLAYRMMKVMSNRINRLTEEVARLEQQLSDHMSSNEVE